MSIRNTCARESGVKIKGLRKPVSIDPSIAPSAKAEAAAGCFSTVGKRWRFRRNLAIYLAHEAGMSQRFLADVFDLPRSGIGTIIQEMRVYERDARA